MINLLIGFMIIPAILGILLLVFWSIEFFKYIVKLLKRHYANKLNPEKIEEKEEPENEVIEEPNVNVIDIDDEENNQDNSI